MQQSDRDELCWSCGKPKGTGTLFDQFKFPPHPYTSIHRLYLLIKLDFKEFPSREAQAGQISDEEWREFASVRRCLICASSKTFRDLDLKEAPK